MQLQRDEIEAGGQILVHRRPAIAAQNEITSLVLGGDEARGLLDTLGRYVSRALEKLERGKDEADGAFLMRALQIVGAWFVSNPTEIMALASETLLPIVASRGALIAVAALDTHVNRKRLAADKAFVEEWGDPTKLEEAPGQTFVPPQLRTFYSPVLRRWAMECVTEAYPIALRTVSMLFMESGLGKRFGTHSRLDTAPAASVPNGAGAASASHETATEEPPPTSPQA